MEAPRKIQPGGPRDYLEIMSKVVFQSGMSYKVVEAKWPGIRDALHDFDPDRIAHLSEAEVDRLAEDPRVIRNRRKLDAIVTNAQTLLELDARPGGFEGFLREPDDHEGRVTALRKNFKYMGPTGCYYFLYVVGEDVPPHTEVMRKR